MNKSITWAMALTLIAFIGQGCSTQHKIETVHKIEVAPMHITIDVNVKVDKALDDFFGDLDETEEGIKPSNE